MKRILIFCSMILICSSCSQHQAAEPGKISLGDTMHDIEISYQFDLIVGFLESHGDSTINTETSPPFTSYTFPLKENGGKYRAFGQRYPGNHIEQVTISKNDSGKFGADTILCTFNRNAFLVASGKSRNTAKSVYQNLQALSAMSHLFEKAITSPKKPRPR